MLALLGPLHDRVDERVRHLGQGQVLGLCNIPVWVHICMNVRGGSEWRISQPPSWSVTCSIIVSLAPSLPDLPSSYSLLGLFTLHFLRPPNNILL